MVSLKETERKYQKLLDMLLNPVKKSLRIEFKRAQDTAINDYLEYGSIQNETLEIHREKLEVIAKKGFLLSQKDGSRLQLSIFEKNKYISENERKAYYNDISGQFEMFASIQAINASEYMARTTEEVVNWLIEKYKQIDDQKEVNGIIDIIADAKKEAKDRSIWRSIIGGLSIVHGGTNKGMNDSANYTAKKKNFIFEKIWITVGDDKVRDTHRTMHRVAVEKDALFEVPISGGGTDFMRYPGDRNATIGNWINCRCSLSYRKKKIK